MTVTATDIGPQSVRYVGFACGWRATLRTTFLVDNGVAGRRIQVQGDGHGTSEGDALAMAAADAARTARMAWVGGAAD